VVAVLQGPTNFGATFGPHSILGVSCRRVIDGLAVFSISVAKSRATGHPARDLPTRFGGFVTGFNVRVQHIGTQRTETKREAGVNPARSRHCNHHPSLLEMSKLGARKTHSFNRGRVRMRSNSASNASSVTRRGSQETCLTRDRSSRGRVWPD
jgi:hypothetical protein